MRQRISSEVGRARHVSVVVVDLMEFQNHFFLGNMSSSQLMDGDLRLELLLVKKTDIGLHDPPNKSYS